MTCDHRRRLQRAASLYLLHRLLAHRCHLHHMAHPRLEHTKARQVRNEEVQLFLILVPLDRLVPGSIVLAQFLLKSVSSVAAEEYTRALRHFY